MYSEQDNLYVERENLTPRERQVLAGVALLDADAAIAEHYSITPKTVSKHLEGIFPKLEVHSRTQAVLKGIQLGEIPKDRQGWEKVAAGLAEGDAEDYVQGGVPVSEEVQIDSGLMPFLPMAYLDAQLLWSQTREVMMLEDELPAQISSYENDERKLAWALKGLETAKTSVERALELMRKSMTQLDESSRSEVMRWLEDYVVECGKRNEDNPFYAEYFTTLDTRALQSAKAALAPLLTSCLELCAG